MTNDDRDLIGNLLVTAESFRIHGDGPKTAALLARAAERLRDLLQPSPEFEQVMDGEWFEPKPQHGHLMKCCDCGLVHRMNFRVSDGKVQLQAFRLPESTTVTVKPDSANACSPSVVTVPVKPTQAMLYAMAELDGWKRGDREHPMLTRWEDYWTAALSALPGATNSAEVAQKKSPGQ